MLTFFKYNFTEQFILIVALGVFLITLAAIEANEGIIMGKIMLCILVFGMLYRTLQDGTIYNFFQGALLALIAGAIVWHKQIKPRRAYLYAAQAGGIADCRRALRGHA